MLHKTRGIIFHVTAFSESSVVVKIYTELFGLQSYLVNGVRNKKSKIKPGVFQPLSLVEIIVYHKERSGLQRIKEIRPVSGGFVSIPFDMMKNSMVIFMNEIVYKSVKEEEANQSLFDFMFHAIQLLDLRVKADTDFHLRFATQLTKYLGFFPNGCYSEDTPVFNLVEGTFQNASLAHAHSITPPIAAYFDALIKSPLSDAIPTAISTPHKRELIEKLLEYYALHLTGFGKVKSHKVLEEVWS